MAGTLKALLGPAYLSSSAGTNIYNNASNLLYTVIRHIHLFNTDTQARTVTLYIGLTGGSAGGTEIFKTLNIPANSPYDYYCTRKLLSTDFLTGSASSASTVTIDIEGELYAV